jgi:cytochrome c peroxidase
VQTGPSAGDGRDNPYKDSRLRAFALPPGDKADLLALLQALTDSAFVTNRMLANPWR